METIIGQFGEKVKAGVKDFHCYRLIRDSVPMKMRNRETSPFPFPRFCATLFTI